MSQPLQRSPSPTPSPPSFSTSASPAPSASKQPATSTNGTSSPPPEPKPPTPPYSGFTPARRRLILGLVSSAGFLGPLAGGIYLPSLPVLEVEFGVSSTAINASVSVFMALCAVSPLFWSALADWKGRRPLYLAALSLYLVVNVLLATVPANFGALIFLRAVQAFGASAVISLGAGAVADITEPAKRGFAMSIFLLGPNLGPTLGPVLGGVITGQTSWRWTFGVLAIAVGFILLLILLLLPETLRARVGDGTLHTSNHPSLLLPFPPRLAFPLAPESHRGPAPPKPSLALFLRLLRTPPITISSTYTAILFANYFAIAVDLPTTLTTRYGFSVTAVGGGYLCLGVAIVSGSLLSGRFSDWRRKQMASRSADGTVEPAGRLIDQFWGTALCAAGSVLYGWLVHFDQGGAAPVLVATFVCGFGMSSVLVVTFAFLTECAPQAAAGAMALEQMLRNPAAAIAAVLTPVLLGRMGYGWFFTGFALLDVAVVALGSLALGLFGGKWKPKAPMTAPAPPAKVEEALPTTEKAPTDAVIAAEVRS